MKTYAFGTMAIIVNGFQVTQFSEDDDAVTIERLEDAASHKISVDGSMAVALSSNRSGMVTLKLMQTSPGNKFLLDLHNRQGTGPFNFTPVQILVQDTYRQDRANASSGYMKKLADIKRGGVINTQEWQIVVERLDVQLGDPGFAGLPTILAEAL